MNVPALNLQIIHDNTNQQLTRAQSANIRKSLLNSRSSPPAIMPSTQQNPVNSRDQLDTMKQLFNRPTEAILQKMNQRRIGFIENGNKDSFESKSNFLKSKSPKKEVSIDYSIEISRNHISPSLDIPYLQLILEKHPQQRTIKELHFVRECLQSLEIFQSWHDNQLLTQSINQTLEQQCEEEYQNLLIYKYLIHHTYNKYSALFYQDDIPKECYVILKGEALMLQKDSSKKEIKTEIQISQILIQYELEREEYDKVNEQYPNHTIIGRISKQNF